MFADLLSTHYDSYDPDYSPTLVHSLGSYINLKLDHERKTPEFIKDLRQRLYFIHEYNCQVAKVTNRYPRSRQLDLLLIKYVELEFDLLYHNNAHPPRQRERTIGLRVLRLLQVMLYPAVLNNEPLINKSTDRALKNAVLELLGGVRPAYLVKDKLVYNIANTLLKRIDGTNGYFENFSFRSDAHRNLATSDYGSDSDSDFESHILFKKLSSSNSEYKRKECREVPVASNGITPVPTVEFTDDEDSYFVYLQKYPPTKRKISDEQKTVCRKKNSNDRTNNSGSNKNISPVSNLSCEKEVSDSSESSKTPNLENGAKEVVEKSDDSCVIVCSDSEDEVSEVTLSGTASKKVQIINESNSKKAKTEKNVGVVTFEILDDDDDDDSGQTNYMVYLQKEVETNVRSKKREVDSREIIICSDSEDESSDKSPESSLEKSLQPAIKDNAIVISDQNSSRNDDIVPLEEAKCPPSISVHETSNNKLEVSESDFPQKCAVTFDSHFKQNEVNSDFPKEIVCHKVNEENEEQNKDITGINGLNNEVNLTDETDQLPSTSTNENFLVFGNDVVSAINEESNTHFLVDPSVILEQMTENQLFKNESSCEQQTKDIAITETDLHELVSVPGGPTIAEKFDSFEDLGNTSECRINESLLELLLDDNYLLEGRKEFEELEYFLFNDNTEKGSYLSSIPLDDCDQVSKPETFDADIKSLESFLDDSNLISLTDTSPEISDLSQSSGSAKSVQNSGDVNFENIQRSSNGSLNTNKRSSRRGRGKNYKTIFKQFKKVNKR